MIIVFQEKQMNKPMGQKVLNNIIKLIQIDQNLGHSIKEDNNRLKVYIKNVVNINDSIEIIKKIQA